MGIASVMRQLRQERDRAAKEVLRLDSAIVALGGKYGRRTGKRNVSAEAREKIAAAQREQWARVRGSKGRPNGAARRAKRTMSAAARAKIAKAQRLRWAKQKIAVQKAA